MNRLAYRVDCIAYVKNGTPYEHKKPQTVARFMCEGDANLWAKGMYSRLNNDRDVSNVLYTYVLDVYKGRRKVYRAG